MGWNGKKPTDFGFDVAKTAEENVKKITMDAVQSLVVSSPVDTGAYRASHIFSVGSADFGVCGAEINANQSKHCRFSTALYLTLI